MEHAEHAPGYRDFPEHKIRELRIDASTEAEVDGEVLAKSRRAVRVEEDDHLERIYFPRADVNMKSLKPSHTTTDCPFKGTASYFDVVVHGHKYRDAAWTYEEPYTEHAQLKGMIAFYAEKLPGLTIDTPAEAPQQRAQKAERESVRNRA